MVMKRSIAKLVRKKLSDITNTPMHPKLKNEEEKHADKNRIEELLQEKAVLMQLLDERDKILELAGAELLKLQDNVEKLQLQNLNLAQSNSQMLAELNLGKERMKALQHEILCKAALLQGKNSKVRGIEDMDHQNEKSEFYDRRKKSTKRSLSTGSVPSSLNDSNKNSSETENARTHLSILKPPSREDKTFRKPLRKTQNKVQHYKEVPQKVKLRRLE